MNLKELLKKYRIEVPILQRDYAQGRKSQSKIANEFLSAIFNVLNGKRQSLHIDFIYGYQENDKFLLIDGQQRITTLWLLHFYLYKKAGCLEQIKNLLAKFSYNTRRSSANFCKNLLKKDFDINEKPSEAIKNKGGEFEKAENLNNDPTIKAMLNMLDWIFEEVKNKREIKKLAENLDNITFDLFNMGKFELGEELYIKMNARGKQLSKYENLKSFIEKDSKISKDQKLLENMDTNWSDYFFDSKNPEVFDIRGCNFLHYATLFFVLEREIESKNIKEAIENPSQPINEFYEPLQNIENIKLLDRVVNLCRSFHSLGINEDLKLKNSSFFNKNKTLSYSDICYFFSILFFMKENGEVEKIDKSAFNDYLRVCRHFIENHRLDNPEDHIPFFKLFKHLSQEYENIYQFLIDNPTYEFHKNIYTLEVKKAKLILDSREGGENWEKILNKTSEHKILKGWVDFLLDFSDEKFDFKSYEKQSELKQPNLHKFQQYADITMQILDKEGFLDKNLTLFQRAFLCIGHFGFYNRNYFYGNSPYDNFRDREALNWILKGSKNSSKLPYFKKFLDTLLECKGENLIDKMQEVIKKTDLSQKEWWEQLLIGEEALFDFLNEKKEAFQGYRRIRYWDMKGKDKVKIELLPGLSNTTNVKDLLDYGFYCYCKDRYSSRVSMYECGEKQYGDKFELLPHFSLDNMKVLCNSMESKICFDDKEYPINLEKGSNIFNEFGRILKLIDEDRVIK